MDFSKILENKPLLYGIIGGVVLFLALVVTISIVGASKKPANGTEVTGEPLKADVDLLTTDNAGKAIEIQALLAKYDIAVSRRLDGTKSILYLKKGDCKTGRKACYTSDRDLALIQIVQSGLMDQNVGLEIFDKGDFTSTKEDKKIRLSRAINGELSRLIRRIDGIDNASVFISIPEQTMFTSMQKPVTATVQVTLAKDATKLDQLKVKAITNLLLGSVTGLTAENIAITDTNGNTYHSIMNAEDEMLQRLEENDKYILKNRLGIVDNSIIKPTILSTHNIIVEKINFEKLNEINSKEITYTATFTGENNKIELLKRNCLAKEFLTLKLGSQVMMLKNTYQKDGIINGSTGIIIDFSPNKHYPIVEFTNGKIVVVKPEIWEIRNFNYNTHKLETLATMSQIPLTLSWAITVHKSQGMTIDKAEFDLKNSFAEGQVYVAFSRVKNINGIFIKSLDLNKIKINEKVLKFYKKFGNF